MSNTYWSEDEFLRPSFVSDDVWHTILTNLLNHIGDPVQNLPSALSDHITRLENMGFSNPTDLQALAFDLQQAGDFGTLAERGNSGSLGQGWSSLADIKLLIASDGSKTVSGLVNATVLESLDATQSAQYAVSLPLGKLIGQDGKFSASAEFSRPSFTTNQTQSGDMKLTAITGGYEMKSTNGDMYIFDQDGKLTSFVSATSEEIDVLYDINDRLYRYENAAGNYIEFAYDTSGKLLSVEDANGQQVSYGYDTNGKLSDVDDDAGSTDFTYDSEGNLLAAERVGGAEIAFTYDDIIYT